MKEKKFFCKSLKAFFLLLLAAAVFSGCAMLKDNALKKEQAKELLEKQKKNFASLRSDLKSHKIEIGASSEDIKSLYGEPSDTFGSSSNNSEFQMWTYEYPDAAKKDSYQPIRLYFNNNKLSYWTN